MLEYVSMFFYMCVVDTLQITPRKTVLIVWIIFFWQNDYFTIFIETGPLSCSYNYVDLHQPLICVAHDTNPCVLPASIMRCLFTYVGLL